MYIRMPAERIAILIGKEGRTKRLIESATHTAIEVDENTATVNGEALREIAAAEIIKAIGRGFAPEKAMKLLNEDYALSVIRLDEMTEKSRKRIMGRVIGRNGRAREILEEYTSSDIAVYGRTISVIAKHGDARMACDAVEMLVAGRSHKYVYAAIEKKMKAENRFAGGIL